MDRRDQELLDKQLRGQIPPRHDGTLIAVIVMVFFVGISLGDVLFAHNNQPTRVAFSDATATSSSGAVPTMQQYR